jgi:hypothetical protein
MRGINRVTLVGNLGKDPELRSLAAGTPVAKMALATTETYRLRDGSIHTQTDWHTIIWIRGHFPEPFRNIKRTTARTCLRFRSCSFIFLKTDCPNDNMKCITLIITLSAAIIFEHCTQ